MGAAQLELLQARLPREVRDGELPAGSVLDDRPHRGAARQVQLQEDQVLGGVGEEAQGLERAALLAAGRAG
jgi:hypothetical protein